MKKRGKGVKVKGGIMGKGGKRGKGKGWGKGEGLRVGDKGQRLRMGKTCKG
jgi:hypothetical protein